MFRDQLVCLQVIVADTSVNLAMIFLHNYCLMILETTLIFALFELCTMRSTDISESYCSNKNQAYLRK